MHVLVLSSNSEFAEGITPLLSGVVERYTMVKTWHEFNQAIGADRPSLVILEREAWAEMDSATRSELMEPNRWPPMLILDESATATREQIVLTRRLGGRSPARYQVGQLTIDTRKKRAGIDGDWVTLPPLQYRLLLALARHAGEVVNYGDLMKAVWGYEGEDREARALLKVHVRQIRRRLGLNPEERHYIHSVRGFGYMLSPPEESTET